MESGVGPSRIVPDSAAEPLVPAPSLCPTGFIFPKCFGPQRFREMGREMGVVADSGTFFLILISVLGDTDWDSSLLRI